MMRKNWKNASASSLLRMDPFCRTYSNEMQPFVPSRSEFFRKLYVEPSNKESVQIIDKSIRDAINARTQNLVLCIKGYAGCGKSVYIQRLLHDYVKRGQTENCVPYDLGPLGDEEEYSLNKANVHCLDIGAGTSSDDIRSRYTEDISRMIAKGIEYDADIYTELCNIVITNPDAINHIDGKGQIQREFVEIDSIKDCLLNGYSQIHNAVKEQLRQFDIPLLLAVDCLWRISCYLVDKKKKRLKSVNAHYFICFDNLDAIDDIEQCNGFIKKLCMFRRNLGACQILLNGNNHMYDIKHFVFIVACRTVTWGKLSLSEFVFDDEQGEIGNHLRDYDISEFFEYVDIVEKRIAHYKRSAGHSSQATKVIGEMDIIKRLNKMLYVRQRFKPLFNYNYRKCIEVITKILENWKPYIDEAIDLADECDGASGDGVFSGSSAIFFRTVFEYLKKNHLFESRIMGLVGIDDPTTPDADPIQLTSLARILLQYIYNRINIDRWEMCRLDQIFRYFESIYPLREVRDMIDHLFKRNTAWRRPINIVKQPFAKEYEQATLEQQEWIYHNAEEPDYDRFIAFNICSSGKEYLQFVIAHFEFFACRASRELDELPPLFSQKSHKDIQENQRYRFEDTCDIVLHSVEMCCEKLCMFNNVVMSVKNLSLDEYMKEPIVRRTYRNNPQLHEERIIFCHIYYLESYRDYLINHCYSTAPVDRRKDLNRRVVTYIERYLDLYDRYVKTTERDQVAKKLRNKVQIIVDSDYEDFKTTIAVY